MRSKLFGRLMSFTLSATVALTSGIPTLAFDGGGGALPEEDEEILLLEDEEEAGSDFDVDFEEAEDVSFEEDEEFFAIDDEEAELESYAGAAIKFTNAQADNVDFYTVNGGTATKVVASYAENAKTINVSTDQDYVIYAVPKVGYTLADANFTFAGKYTDANDKVHEITKGTDYIITDELEEYDVTGADIPLQSALTSESFYWNKAKMITFKSSFLQAYENRKTGEGTTTVPIGITVAAPATTTFELPIYILDKTLETPAYNRVTRMTTPTLTYGVGRADDTAIDIANAVADSDWTKYGWATTVELLKADLSGSTKPFTQDDTLPVDDTANEYNVTGTKVSLAEKATVTGYVDTEKSLGAAFMAIILTKSTEGANPEYTLSAADTEYVNFTFEDSEGSPASTQSVTRHKTDPTAIISTGTSTHGEIIAQAKDYDVAVKGLTLADRSTNPARTLPGSADAIIASTESGDSLDVTYETGTWTIPAYEGDVTVTAQTEESVDILCNEGMSGNITAKIVSVNGDDLGTPQTIELGKVNLNGDEDYTDPGEKNYEDGECYTDIKTGTDIKFTAYPNAGYKVNKVAVTRYNVAGTSLAESNVEITPVDGVYEVKNIKSYTIITIEAARMSSSIQVKKVTDTAETNYEYVTLTDVNTEKEITETGDLYAEHGKDYYFRAEPANSGWAIKEMKAVAGEGESAVECEVTYDSEKDLYKIAAVNIGPIVIVPTVVKGLAIEKVTSVDADVTIAGIAVDDEDSITVAGDKAVTIGVTAKNNAEITGVYYSTVNSITTNAGMTTALTDTTPTAWKLSGTNGTYIISANDIITRTGTGGNTIYVYVTTKRDAIQGTDYDSVKIEDIDTEPNDVTSGLTLWAGDGNAAEDTINPIANRTLTATWLKDDEPVISTTDETYLDLKLGFAKTADDTKIANVSAAGRITPTKYNGGAASSDSDVLSLEMAKVDTLAGTANFPTTVTYKASLNVTVKPLRDYYEDLELKVVTLDAPGGSGNNISAIVGEKKIRLAEDGLTDIAKFIPYGKAPSAENAVDLTAAGQSAIKYTAAESETPEFKGIKFTATPKMNSADALAEYKLNFDSAVAQTVTNTGNADIATVSEATKLQTINVGATITFIDGTEATVSNSVEVIEPEYGYYAIPSIVVDGVTTPAYKVTGEGAYDNHALTMELETISGGRNAGKIKYDVYHALTAKGAGIFTAAVGNISAYKVNETEIDNAISSGDIEVVDASAVAWTDVVGASEGYTSNFTVAKGVGEYTVTAVKKTATAGIGVGFTPLPKVGDKAVSVATGATVTVIVAQKLSRYDVTVNTADENAATDYKYPVGTFGTAYTESAILRDVDSSAATPDEVVGFALLKVPVGTKITLPGAEAFTGIEPGRTLAGWKVDSAYKLIGDEITTGTATVLTAIWAPAFYSDKGSKVVDGAGAIRGAILAVNAKTKDAITSSAVEPMNIAVGEQVKVIAGYYPLDIETVATFADDKLSVTYGSDLEYVEDTSKLDLSTATKAEGQTFLGADGTTGKFADATLKGVEVTSSPLITSLKYKLAEGTVFTAADVYVAVTAAEVWKIEAADVSVENGQTITKVLTSLKEGPTEDSLVAKTLADVAAYDFTYSDDSIVEVSVTDGDASDNKLTIKGLKEGSTDVTMTIVSKSNVEASVTFKVTVTKSLLSIVVDVTPNYSTPNKTPETVTVAEGEVAKLWINNDGNDVKIKLIDEDGAEVQAADGLTFATSFTAGTVNATVTSSDATAATQIWKATKLGTATARITVTLTGQNRVYSRDVDIISYGTVNVTGQRPETDLTVKTGTTKKENVCFTVYEGTQVDANKFADSATAYVPVLYDATKKASDKYEVSLDDFTAKWINTDIDQKFLGWNTSAVGINGLAATKKGETLKLSVAQVTSGTPVYVTFAALPIENIYGLPTEIRLSDEAVDGDIAKSDKRSQKTGTDWEEFNFLINPATANEDIKVISSEKGILDIASAYLDDGVTTMGKATQANVLSLAAGSSANVWDGSVALTLGKKVTGTTERIDNFRIGKVAGKVGVSTLYIETANLEIDPITVYLNGEFSDNGTIRYMEDGEILKEGARVVDGITHYYKDSVKVLNGAIKITVGEEEKLILVEGGAQVKVPRNGLRVLDGKTYFIDGDGYLKTGLVTIDDKDYLFREDGSKIFYDDEDLSAEHTITFGDTTYVINEDNTAEEDKFFEVDGEPTWTWQVAEKKVVSATAVFKAKDDRTKTIVVPVADMEVKVEDEEEQISSYKAVATFKSKGQDISAEKTAYFNAEGEEVTDVEPFEKAGEPTWEWKVENKAVVSATATFKSTKDKEKVVVVPVADMTVTVEDENEGINKYVAVAKFTSFGTEVTGTETKYYNAEGEEITDLTPFEVASVEWTWQQADDKSVVSATATFKSTTDKEKVIVVPVSAMTTVTEDDGNVGYTAKASFVSFGKTIEKEVTQYFNPAGEKVEANPFVKSNAEWTWKIENKVATSATVKFTSTDGREKTIEVLSTDARTDGSTKYMIITPNDDYTEYVVYASFVSYGTTVEASETKKLDAEGNDYIPHTGGHVWIPVWTWNNVDATHKTAQLTITCNVGGKSHEIVFPAQTIAAIDEGTIYKFVAHEDYENQHFEEVKNELKPEAAETEQDISGGKGILIVGLDKEYRFTGNAIKPLFEVVDMDRDYDNTLTPGVDYTVSYKNNVKVGTATITIKGKGNYAEKSLGATFAIVDGYEEGDTKADLSKAKMKLPKGATYTFNGENQFPAYVEIAMDGKNYVKYEADITGEYVDYKNSEGEGIPSLWAIDNNRNAGTAVFSLVGQAKSNGQPQVVKKTFKIAPYKLNTSEFKALVAGEEKFETEWYVNGAKPFVQLTWSRSDKDDYTLWNDVEFTTTYKKNKAAGTATVTLKGKGNFKGELKSVASFDVKALNLEDVWFQAVSAGAGIKGKKVTVTLVDHDGVIIPKKNYDVVVTSVDGTDLSGTKLTAGTEIVVKAKAKGANVTGETSEWHTVVQADFSKAKVKTLNKFTKEYTGNAIELEDEDWANFTVKLNGAVLKYGEDFEVIAYANNINKGKMTVTIAPIDGEKFSGSKSFVVKITPKKMKK